MDRRALLAATAATTATALAGCLGGTPASDDSAGTPTPTDSTPDHLRMTDSSFDVTDVECGTTGTDVETRRFDGTVTVEGTVDGNDTCYTAELVRAEYVADEDTLYVEVASVSGGDDEVCGQCIVEIDWVGTFEFENGDPETVRVDQHGVGGSSSSESTSGVSTPPETVTPTSTQTPTSTPTQTPSDG